MLVPKFNHPADFPTSMPHTHLKISHLLSCVQLCDPMDWVRQAPLSVEFSRQEHWSGLSLPTPEDLPNTVIKPESPLHLLHLQVDSLPLVPPGKPQNQSLQSLSLVQLFATLWPKINLYQTKFFLCLFLFISSSSFPKPAKGTAICPRGFPSLYFSCLICQKMLPPPKKSYRWAYFQNRNRLRD